MGKRERVVLRFTPGEQHVYREPNPELGFHPQGKNTYLWIGGRGCFGHVSGPRRLEKFARALLAEVAPEERRRAKLKAKIRARIKAAKRSRP